MGTKRHAALIVKQNTNPEKWDGFLYKWKRRESDFEWGAVKELVFTTKGRLNAYKKIEHAMKERDRNPTENREKNNRGVEFRDRIDLEKLLCSHFRILGRA